MDIETKSNLCRNDIDYKRQHHLLLNRLYCRKKQFEIGVQKKKSSSLRFNIYIYIYIWEKNIRRGDKQRSIPHGIQKICKLVKKLNKGKQHLENDGSL